MNTMNTSDIFPADDVLEEKATTWLLEREEGFTPSRAREFSAWCAQHPRHTAAVQHVEQALSLLEEMPAVRGPLVARFSGAPVTNEGQQEATPNRSERRLLRFPQASWLAMAAAVLVISLSWWGASTFRRTDGQRYATDALQQRVVLEDGSVVDINASSEIRVRFTTHERRLILSSGEAHFQVAHNTARPFVVEAGGVSVRAVGTAFNVKLATGAVDVLVVEGRVQVGHGQLPPADSTAASVPLVAAGERTSVSCDEKAAPPKIEKVDEAAIRATLAWQDGPTSFTDVPLRELVARFNKRNPTQLVLADVELGERKVGGVMALDQVEAFVRLLEQDGDVSAERRPNGEIFLRRVR